VQVGKIYEPVSIHVPVPDFDVHLLGWSHVAAGGGLRGGRRGGEKHHVRRRSFASISSRFFRGEMHFFSLPAYSMAELAYNPTWGSQLALGAYLGIGLADVHLDWNIVLPALIIDCHCTGQDQELAFRAIVVDELFHFGNERAHLA